MCGIAGAFGSSSTSAASVAEVQGMANALVHRGPDHGGIWSDGDNVCLASRRLAIVDLSSAGHQPMHSPSARFVVVLNGEIYNHGDLKARLDAEGRSPIWRGGSDTEVLAAAFDAWGIEPTLKAAIGMFAIAVWDRTARRLTLARDRIGEKPLYYGRCGNVWLFGSELKALVAHPRFRQAIDRDALSGYMALGYVSTPASIYSGIAKLAAACSVTLRVYGGSSGETPYWPALNVARQPRLVFTDPGEAVDALDTLLSDAVARQMIADRPLGALLSGGIDSSSIVAMMRNRTASRIETFSIGFRESSFNEAHHAAKVARHFGTVHTELYVDASDVRDTIPLLPQIYDEPFADVSQIPTFLVSQLASRSVTVALTGDGGDELFGGYPRYAMGARLWPALQRVPRWLRPPIGRAMQSAPASIDRAFKWVFPHDEVSGLRGLRPGQKLHKLGGAVGSRDLDGFYWRLLAPWADPKLLGGVLKSSRFPDPQPSRLGATIEEDFMLRDLVGYLPDDILVKIDRASMAVSLESRAPLLDHRVVEFALRLPHDLKFRDGTSKWLLRQALHRHVPKHLVDRPKMGFEMPIASWLRGPLKSWAYDLLASSRGEASALLDLRALRKLLDRHASGVGDGHQPLWTALMYLNWAHARERSSQAPARSAETVSRIDRLPLVTAAAACV